MQGISCLTNSPVLTGPFGAMHILSVVILHSSEALSSSGRASLFFNCEVDRGKAPTEMSTVDKIFEKREDGSASHGVMSIFKILDVFSERAVFP